MNDASIVIAIAISNGLLAGILIVLLQIKGLLYRVLMSSLRKEQF